MSFWANCGGFIRQKPSPRSIRTFVSRANLGRCGTGAAINYLHSLFKQFGPRFFRPVVGLFADRSSRFTASGLVGVRGYLRGLRISFWLGHNSGCASVDVFNLFLAAQLCNGQFCDQQSRLKHRHCHRLNTANLEKNGTFPDFRWRLRSAMPIIWTQYGQKNSIARICNAQSWQRFRPPVRTLVGSRPPPSSPWTLIVAQASRLRVRLATHQSFPTSPPASIYPRPSPVRLAGPKLPSEGRSSRSTVKTSTCSPASRSSNSHNLTHHP